MFSSGLVLGGVVLRDANISEKCATKNIAAAYKFFEYKSDKDIIIILGLSLSVGQNFVFQTTMIY